MATKAALVLIVTVACAFGMPETEAREYDPRVGRFLSRDPLFENRVQQHYMYVLNEPTQLTDATGRQPKQEPEDDLTRGLAANFQSAMARQIQRIAPLEKGGAPLSSAFVNLLVKASRGPEPARILARIAARRRYLEQKSEFPEFYSMMGLNTLADRVDRGIRSSWVVYAPQVLDGAGANAQVHFAGTAEVALAKATPMIQFNDKATGDDFAHEGLHALILLDAGRWAFVSLESTHHRWTALIDSLFQIPTVGGPLGRFEGDVRAKEYGKAMSGWNGAKAHLDDIINRLSPSDKQTIHTAFGIHVEQFRPEEIKKRYMMRSVEYKKVFK